MKQEIYDVILQSLIEVDSISCKRLAEAMLAALIYKYPIRSNFNSLCTQVLVAPEAKSHRLSLTTIAQIYCKEHASYKSENSTKKLKNFE